MTDPTHHAEPDALEAALAYAARGWRVIPIKAGGKHPPVPAWQDAATTDEQVIRSWFTGLYRGSGVGVATGEASGVWVLDVDVSGDKRGDDTLADLCDSYGDLPDTVASITGSGGRHYFFAWPAGVDLRNNQSGKLGEGLDVRANGGQVVVAPSIHPNGRRYEWEDGHAPGEIELAPAPGWLLALLEPDEPALPPTVAPTGLADDDDSPAAAFNAATTWAELLTRDGWTLGQTLRDGEERWVRPGKDVRDGTSATVGHDRRDVLKVFTSSVPALEADRAYSRFGYEAAVRYGGDRSALARALRAEMPHDDDVLDLTAMERHATTTVDGEPITADAATVAEVAHLVDWPSFWASDHASETWAVYPLVPAGRAVSLYAPAKAGKSSVVLAAVAAAATGRRILGDVTPAEPVDVLYLDYEMTEADLQERLVELGYGPEIGLSRLHYALLPSIPPLDTAAGAAAVVALAQAVSAALVVVDTFGRATEGEENDADTVRAFYRHTGIALKAAGVAVLRTDHSGKETERGQRGSSAKNDDVDVVWRLTRSSEGVRLDRTHSRISWVPDRLDLRRHEDDMGRVTYTTDDDSYPAGTKEKAELFDRLGIPLDATRTQVRQALKGTGETCRNDLVGAVQKWRRKEQARFDDDLEIAVDRAVDRTYPQATDRGPQSSGPDHETPRQSRGPGRGPAWTEDFALRGPGVPPLRGTPAQGRSDDDDIDLSDLF